MPSAVQQLARGGLNGVGRILNRLSRLDAFLLKLGGFVIHGRAFPQSSAADRTLNSDQAGVPSRGRNRHACWGGVRAVHASSLNGIQCKVIAGSLDRVAASRHLAAV
jgi:hypothetical protein